MGSIYPVYENCSTLNYSDNLHGKSVKNGFDSHYVLIKHSDFQPISMNKSNNKIDTPGNFF